MDNYETVGERAQRLYPGETIDYALPQWWVDEYCLMNGSSPVGRYVWIYRQNGLLIGEPAPLFD